MTWLLSGASATPKCRCGWMSIPSQRASRPTSSATTFRRRFSSASKRQSCPCTSRRRFHHVTAADDHRHRVAVPQRLCEDRHVGCDPQILLRPSRAVTQPGRDFIQNEDRTVLANQPPHSGQVAVRRNLGTERLHDDRRDFVPMLVQQLTQCREVSLRERQRRAGKGSRPTDRLDPRKRCALRLASSARLAARYQSCQP